MMDSDAVGPVAKKRSLLKPWSLVAPSGVHKYFTSYAHSLYPLGIEDSDETGIISSVPDHAEVFSLVSAPGNLRSLATYMGISTV